MRPAIEPLLGVVMFGMGVTLTPGDFGAVLRTPWLVAFGVGLQFGLMPLLAFLLAKLLALSPELAAGLVLVGSCPGGTASNVICYLARADVALSITLTLVSTLLAVVLTPLLTELYAGRRVDVDVAGMMLAIARVVLLPVALGVAARRLLGTRIGALERIFPLLSVSAIVVIIAIVVALSAAQIRALTGLLALAVVLHNGLGLLLGYTLARIAGLDEARCRTLAIEVGMQNSGLGVALAVRYLTPLAGLPGALFSIWHNLSGSALAALWGRRAGVARSR